MDPVIEGLRLWIFLFPFGIDTETFTDHTHPAGRKPSGLGVLSSWQMVDYRGKLFRVCRYDTLYASVVHQEMLHVQDRRSCSIAGTIGKPEGADTFPKKYLEAMKWRALDVILERQKRLWVDLSREEIL